MRIKKISFYDNFKCIGSECPDCCCKGWIIPLNEDDLEKFHSLPLFERIKIFISARPVNGGLCFNKSSMVCPFLTKEKLCHFQKNYGEEYLCQTCLEFPRYINNYGEFITQMLDLSCPLVVNLFLDNYQNIEFIETIEDFSYELTATNDDTDYLFDLEVSENMLSSHIRDKRLPLPVIWNDLIEYGTNIQQSYIKDATTQILKEEYSFASKDSYCPDIITIDKIIHSGFYHKKLKKTDPELFRLIRLYDKKFTNERIDISNNLLKDILSSLEKYYQDTDSLLRGYCSYNLKCTYFSVYNDYSFKRHLSLCVIHSFIFALLLFLHADDKGSLDKEDIAKIICAYDKRARHNLSILNQMYQKM